MGTVVGDRDRVGLAPHRRGTGRAGLPHDQVGRVGRGDVGGEVGLVVARVRVNLSAATFAWASNWLPTPPLGENVATTVAVPPLGTLPISKVKTPPVLFTGAGLAETKLVPVGMVSVTTTPVAA